MDKIILYAIIAIVGVALLALLFKVIALIFKVLIPVVILLASIVVAVKYVLKKEES